MLHEKHLAADDLTCIEHSLETGSCSSLVNLKNTALKQCCDFTVYNLQRKMSQKGDLFLYGQFLKASKIRDPEHRVVYKTSE